MASVKPIPDGLHTVTPNLTFKDCARAIDFYRRALGAEEVMRMPAPDGRRIWHAELRVQDSVIYLNDEMPGMSHAPEPGGHSPVAFWLYVKDCDAAHQRAVKAGARSLSEPSDMFWGDRVGGVADPFGYTWTFATHVKDLSEAEMRRAGEQWAREHPMGT
jgi:uncharacterized glyoxalase superfamily protein PhnB